LYISSLDQQRSARMEDAQDTVADLKTAQSQIGQLDERFGWGELPDIGVVLLSRPRRYIEQLRQFSSKRAEATNKQDVLT
ncbi:EscC/YscC/HrcC family type III secretion system outer membrane ring protein, partial [Pseudomonas sp. CCI3.1]|nr:EscC/YscC/HrcC family type III secretion system outer membrane ring protein [Pseudomonas sp. CCI3.1]